MQVLFLTMMLGGALADLTPRQKLNLKATRPLFHLVLDVGSSGTTPLVFVYSDPDAKPDAEAKGQKNQPGLDDFGVNAINKGNKFEGVTDAENNGKGNLLTEYLDNLWADALKVLKSEKCQRRPHELVIVDILCTAGMRELRDKRTDKAKTRAYMDAVQNYLKAKTGDDQRIHFAQNKIITGADEAMGSWWDINKNNQSGTYCGMIEMGGSSLQVKCEKDSYVSFANYGANDIMEEYYEKYFKQKGEYKEGVLKLNDINYDNVKNLFWTPSDNVKEDPFHKVGLLKENQTWNTGFQDNVMGGKKRPFKLACCFYYMKQRFIKRLKAPKDVDYFGKCKELIDAGLKDETFQTLSPAEDKFSTPAQCKMQVCFHYAMYELMKDHMTDDIEIAEIQWPRGLSMLYMSENFKTDNTMWWVIGGAVLVLVILCGVWCCCRKKGPEQRFEAEYP